MYAIVFRETTRASLKMCAAVYEDKERAETNAKRLREREGYQAWLVFFDDPRK